MNLLLFAWLPPEAPRMIYQAFRRLVGALGTTPSRLILIVSALAGGTGLLYSGRNGFGAEMQAVDLGLGMWWWQTAVMLLALWSIRALSLSSATPLLKPPFAVLWIYVGLLIFNCLCPYIGLKTRTTLTMHCNLRTEKGYWNHLFLPSRMRVFGYQDDLVVIEESDLSDFTHLRETGMPLPYFEFRRWCHLAPGDFYVDYRRQGGPCKDSKRGMVEDPIWS